MKLRHSESLMKNSRNLQKVKHLRRKLMSSLVLLMNTSKRLITVSILITRLLKLLRMRPMISMLSSRNLRKLIGLRTMIVLLRLLVIPKRLRILDKVWKVLRTLWREECWRKSSKILTRLSKNTLKSLMFQRTGRMTCSSSETINSSILSKLR